MHGVELRRVKRKRMALYANAGVCSESGRGRPRDGPRIALRRMKAALLEQLQHYKAQTLIPIDSACCLRPEPGTSGYQSGTGVCCDTASSTRLKLLEAVYIPNRKTMFAARFKNALEIREIRQFLSSRGRHVAHCRD